MTFSDLNLSKPLLDALDDLGFTEATTIQEKAFAPIMSGRDVCGIAQTGTGKTFAYLLPCLRLIKYSKDRFPQMLIVVPTRELVDQAVEAIKQLTTYMTLEVAGVYGGVNINRHILAVDNGIDILVATPGRLLDLVYHGVLKLKAIKRLVIDEVDEVFNLGFRTQLNNILDVLPPKRQNILFSATITPEVEALINTHFDNVLRIEAAPMGTPLENIDQVAYDVPNFNTKANLLEYLITNDERMEKVLVFTATKNLANQLYERLDAEFVGKVGVIHSNKEQNNRINTVIQFKQGGYPLLIATDIIARGLDVSEVTHVINFDTPEEPEDYIHRIGRTGRADKKGISITFITPKEKEQQEAIENLMHYKIPMLPLPEDLEISDVLTEDEKPKIFMRETLVKPVKREDAGPAFHEKSAKNKKVNVKVRHADKMMQKYGKPKTRGGKK